MNLRWSRPEGLKTFSAPKAYRAFFEVLHVQRMRRKIPHIARDFIA